MKTDPTPPPAAPAPTALVIPKYFFVIDVESVGLHGEPFAVGWSVHSRTGGHYEEGFLACPMSEAKGSDQDREWCLKNIPLIPANRRTPRAVRDAFWPVWMLWKEQDAVMVADCGWPVESHFLALCIADDSTRNWNGPYPLHDVASVLLAASKDPLANHERNIEELPKHHPMKDARQSGRILCDTLRHLTELQARCAALEEDALHGKLIAAGDLELFEDGKPVAVTGVFVECTHEALRNLRGNLIYSDVSIAARPSVAARGHKEGV